MSLTKECRINDTEIKKSLLDAGVKQLKDTRYSLYLKFNTRRNGGSWVLCDYRKNKQHKHTLGHWPQLAASHLFDRLPAIMADLAQGLTPVVSCFFSIDQVLNWYVLRVKNTPMLSKSRKSQIHSCVNKHLILYLKDQPVSVPKYDFDALVIQKMLSAGYAPATVKQVFGVFKTAMKQAAGLGHIENNPSADWKYKDFVSQPVKPKSSVLRDFMLPDLFARLGEMPREFILLFVLMLSCGTRIGETILSRWANIDLDGGVWVLPASDTKTGCELTVYLPPLLIKLLGEYRDCQRQQGYQGAYVFSVKNRRMSAALAHELFRDFSEKNFTSHQLRKLARTCWTNNGVDYLVGEFLLNHSLKGMDATYIHTHARALCTKALAEHAVFLQSKGLRDDYFDNPKELAA